MLLRRMHTDSKLPNSSVFSSTGKREKRCRHRCPRRVQASRHPVVLLVFHVVIVLATLSSCSRYNNNNSNSNSKPWVMASAAAALASNSKAACSAIPRLGLGTYLMTGEQCTRAIPSAIALGYRRIDCAPVYFNEDKVGDALQSVLVAEGAVQRNDLFIVSKLASPFHRPEHVELALRKTLSDLRLEYLDLFLIHWPVAFYPVVPIPMETRGWPTEDIDDSGNGQKIDPSVSIHDTWAAMEELVTKGLVKAIGVSNFPVALLHELLTKAKIPPLVNQVEAHPYLQQTKLLQYCQARGIHFQAYSPLGTPGYKESQEPYILEDPVLQQIANKYNVSVAHICLTWAIQRGTSVVAKSASPQHQEENMRAFAKSNENNSQEEEQEQLAITLSEQDMQQIASLDRGYRYFRPNDWWPEMGMAVFD